MAVEKDIVSCGGGVPALMTKRIDFEDAVEWLDREMASGDMDVINGLIGDRTNNQL